MGVKLEACLAQEGEGAAGGGDVVAAAVLRQHLVRQALDAELDLGGAEAPDAQRLFLGQVIGPRLDDRRRLAAKAYAHTASYDTAITRYLSRSLGDEPLGERMLYSGRLVERMRYGENPHQQAAFYVAGGAGTAMPEWAEQLQGKALSYTNVLDIGAAAELILEGSNR